MRGTSLIVLAWNQWELTRRCLDSLLATSLDEVQLIVVDNGSSDGTREGINAYRGRLDYRRLPENLGFVRGMNAGIAAAKTDNDIVLLNNDLEFIQSDWLGRLRDAAYASAETGIVGCRLLGPEPDNLVFHVGGFIEPDGLWGQQTESGQQERDVGQFPRTRRVQGIAFALAYLRSDCIARIGVLDEIFHSYFEDTDYCLRAADAGIAAVVAGAVTLRHHQHGSTRDDGGFRARLWTQSRAAFAARWQQRLLARYRATLHWQGLTRAPRAEATLARGVIGRLDARGWRTSFAATTPELLASDDFRVMTAA
ncbi:MAG: glycosyltransferase family 2 protein, partial [Dokdonella sp.]